MNKVDPYTRSEMGKEEIFEEAEVYMEEEENWLSSWYQEVEFMLDEESAESL